MGMIVIIAFLVAISMEPLIKAKAGTGSQEKSIRILNVEAVRTTWEQEYFLVDYAAGIYTDTAQLPDQAGVDGFIEFLGRQGNLENAEEWSHE